jgi:hypothetical protein
LSVFRAFDFEQMSSLVDRAAYKRLLAVLKAKADGQLESALTHALAELDRLRDLIDYAPPVRQENGAT